MSIEFSGKIGKIKLDDYQLAMGLKTSKGFLRIRYFFLIVAIGFLLISLVLWGINSNNGSFGFTFLGIGFLIIGGVFTALNAIQRNKVIDLYQDRKGKISEEGITIRGKDSEDLIKWAFFQSYRKSDDLIILISNRGSHIMSRSLFATEDDWIQAARLVSSFLIPLDDPKPYFIRLLPSLIIMLIVFAFFLFMVFRSLF